MRFRETQLCPWWVWALLGYLILAIPLMSLFLGPSVTTMGGIWAVPVALGVIVALVFGQMTTEIDATDLRISFGFVRLVRFRFPLNEFVAANPETYRPIMEFGGWGIRGFGSNRALNMRGSQGVRLTFANGRRLMVGSCLPSELASAMRQVIHAETIRF